MSSHGFLSSIKRKISSARQSDNPQNRHPYSSSVMPDIKTATLTSSSTRNPPTMNTNTLQPPRDAPPAYSSVPARAVSPAPSTSDDAYAFLSTFDTVFLIDDSGSMAGSRWTETLRALETVVPVCVSHDADGIDMMFLNAPDSPWHHNITSAATVREIFSAVRPRGGTPTGQRINSILRPYTRKLEESGEGAVKPLNLIVITDGEPSDDVEAGLIAAAKKLDRLDAPAWQVGVQFFQVGRDEGASRHLRMLDDELAQIAGQSIRDMVDTVPFNGELSGEGILKVVLGAVNRRLDRRVI